MTDDELRARVAELFWWHSIELRPGIVTPGHKSREAVRTEADALFRGVALEGRSVLDIGAWNGAFSFAAAQRGARHVLAVDSYTWRHPNLQGRRGFDLARSALGLDARVTAQETDLMELTPAIGRFDVTLLLGVFYHLLDPIEGLRRAAEVTTGSLLIETHQDATDQARPMMVFYPGSTLADDATNWWGPNPVLMLELLREFGFARMRYMPHPAHAARHARGLFAAFRADAPAGLDSGDWRGWIDLDDPGERRRIGLPG